jgi:hypothetical protein
VIARSRSSRADSGTSATAPRCGPARTARAPRRGDDVVPGPHAPPVLELGRGAQR